MTWSGFLFDSGHHKRKAVGSFIEQHLNQELISFLGAALECSVYFSPREPGLTIEELSEIGRRILDGKIGDHLRIVTTSYFGRSRLLPSQIDVASWVFFMPEAPEYRNFGAFNFVVQEINMLMRSEGAQRARIERAVAKGISRNHIEVVITWLAMAKQLTDKDTSYASHIRSLVGCQANSSLSMAPECTAGRIASAPIHSSGMSSSGAQMDARSMQFRQWWSQTVAEIRQSNPSSHNLAFNAKAAKPSRRRICSFYTAF